MTRDGAFSRMVSRCLEEEKAAADKVGDLMSHSLCACTLALKTPGN